MINESDIIDSARLTRADVAAIAASEHIAPVVAAEMGEYPMQIHKGPHRAQRMIRDDIREAIHADDVPCARALYATLKAFLAEHPEALRGSD